MDPYWQTFDRSFLFCGRFFFARSNHRKHPVQFHLAPARPFPLTLHKLNPLFGAQQIQRDGTGSRTSQVPKWEKKPLAQAEIFVYRLDRFCFLNLDNGTCLQNVWPTTCQMSWPRSPQQTHIIHPLFRSVLRRARPQACWRSGTWDPLPAARACRSQWLDRPLGLPPSHSRAELLSDVTPPTMWCLKAEKRHNDPI